MTQSFEKPGPVETDWKDVISSIEDIIDDARNGRMFVLCGTILAKKLASSVKAGFHEGASLRHRRLLEPFISLLTLIRHLLGVLFANEFITAANPPRGRIVIARGFTKERVHTLREFICGRSGLVL